MPALIERHGYLYIEGCEHVKLKPAGKRFDLVHLVSGCLLGESFKQAAGFDQPVASLSRTQAIETAIFADNWLRTDTAGRAKHGQKPIKTGQKQAQNNAINILQLRPD